jgi:hypothetical protein
MRDFQRGKRVQFRERLVCPVSTGGVPDIPPYDVPWVIDNSPAWNWSFFEYRIKQEPREWWLVEWPTRVHVYDSIECAMDASKQLFCNNHGRVYKVKEVTE